MPVKYTAACNKMDWVGFSPRTGLTGGSREGPAAVLFLAGPAPQRCAWELARRLGDSAILSVADLFSTSSCAVVRGGAGGCNALECGEQSGSTRDFDEVGAAWSRPSARSLQEPGCWFVQSLRGQRLDSVPAVR